MEEVGGGSPTGHPASVNIENLPELVGSVTVKFGAVLPYSASGIRETSNGVNPNPMEGTTQEERKASLKSSLVILYCREWLHRSDSSIQP